MEFPWNKQRYDKIFISYRRDDSAGHAGRLSDSLSDYFGEERVYMDVKDIEYAQDYKDAIEESLSETGALLVVIGEQWCSVTDEEGKRRLENPQDDVSREIQLALDNDRTVLPVLIGDAVMPSADDLPAKLKNLSRRNAIALSDERWHFDVDRLAKVLSIDLPSYAQRKLNFWRSVASLILLFGCAFSAIFFAGEVFAMIVALEGQPWKPDSNGSSLLRAIPALEVPEGKDWAQEEYFGSFRAAILFIAIGIAGCIVGYSASLMEKSKTAWGIVGFAAVSLFSTFILFLYINTDARLPSLTITFISGVLTALTMLALMNLAEFKAK